MRNVVLSIVKVKKKGAYLLVMGLAPGVWLQALP